MRSTPTGSARWPHRVRARLDGGGGCRGHPRDRVGIGKRQLEEMIRRAAAHIDAFYLSRVIVPRRKITAGADLRREGIVMLPGALRPATAKAAAAAQSKLATRLSPGRRTAASGWPSWPASMTRPRSRAPRGHHQHPRAEAAEQESPGSQADREGEAAEPQAQGKWLTASVTDDIPAVISTAFGEAERRDPAASANGSSSSTAQHPDRGRHRGGRGPRRHRHDQHRLHPRARIPVEGRLVLLRQGEPAAEEWVAEQARKILHGKARQVAPESAAAPPPTATPRPSARRRRCARSWRTSRVTWTTPPR